MCSGASRSRLEVRPASRETGDGLTETSHDIWGYLIALVANLAIVARALPIAPPGLLTHYSWYLPALVVLLAWSIHGGKNYLRWRPVVQAVFRLQCFLLPGHKRVWALFNSQPPRWHTGAGSELLNAGVFAAGLLGQSFVGVLALLTFSNRLALWLHISVQLISIGALMTQHNAEMCASALMKNEVAGGLLHGLHGWFSLMAAVVPLPVWPLPAAAQAVQCRQALAFLQVMLGFVLPSFIQASQECQALLREEAGAGSSRPDTSRTCSDRTSTTTAASLVSTGSLPSLGSAAGGSSSSSSSGGDGSSTEHNSGSDTGGHRGVGTSGDAARPRASSISGAGLSGSVISFGRSRSRWFTERLNRLHGRLVSSVAGLHLAASRLPELIVLVPALAWLTICTLIQ